MPVSSLGYLHLDTDDPDAWQTFAEGFLGLMPTPGPDPDAQHYRMDDFPARLVVHQADEPGVRAIGFEIENRRALAALVDELKALGVDVRDGSSELAAERQVTALVCFDDPGGNPVEVFYGPVLNHQRVSTPLVSGFQTGPQGMGHIIVSAPDIAASYDFYVDGLGLWERNSMKAGADDLFFMACNERHHTLGLLPMPGPGQLIHLMIEVDTLDDVGYALDRADDLDVPMMQSLGRHTNDHMVSFYVSSPEGYAVEIGWGGLRIPEQAPTYEITQGAFWGHRPPK